MSLSDYREADISNDGTVVKYSYPEDKLKASIKELKERFHDAHADDIIDKEFGAELNE